jgi:hypothetical protein
VPRANARQARQRPRWVSRSADWSSESSPSTRRDAQPRARSHCSGSVVTPGGTRRAGAG